MGHCSYILPLLCLKQRLTILQHCSRRQFVFHGKPQPISSCEHKLLPIRAILREDCMCTHMENSSDSLGLYKSGNCHAEIDIDLV